MRNLLTTLLVILAFLLLLSDIGCHTDKTGRIVFLSSGKLNTDDIYSMNPAGSELVKLARWIPRSMPFHNVWSAGGKRLAYVDSDNETKRRWLSVVDGNGKNRRRLLDITDLKMDSMALSPNGKTVILSIDAACVDRIETPIGESAYIEITENTDRDLFAVDVKTGQLKRLTETPDTKELRPSYSPTGKLIAFTGQIDTKNRRDVPQEICVMDANGDNRRRLAYHAEGWPYGGVKPDLQWSPDGTKIAYSYSVWDTDESRDYTDIFVIDLKGGSLINLTNTPHAKDTGPLWSPDSRRIIFYSERYRTLVMDIVSGNVTELYPTWHSWTPDGRGFIFTNPMNVFELMVMDADGKNPRTLARTGDVRISNPIWLYE